MKKPLFLFITLILFLQACKDRDFAPVDIFDEEELPTDDEGNIIQDSTVQSLGSLCNDIQLFASKERVQELPGGFQVKGTLFAQTDEGLTSISSGDFSIAHASSGNLASVSGFGSMLMPKVGFFKDNFLTSDLFGAELSYGAGATFRDINPEFPLVNEDCYFRFNVDPAADFLQGKIGGPIMVGSTLLNFKDMFLQANTPAILFHGDIYQFDKNAKPEALPEGASKFKKFKAKAGKLSPKWSITNAYFGIAARAHFPFRAYEYSEELNEIVGGTNFQEFQGHLYIKGTVPLKKYPIDITGEAVVENSFSSLGALDLFENGFDNAAYRMGINGQAEFGHALLDILPLDLRVTLGQATVQVNVDQNESFLRMAGEYDSGRLYEEILGPEIVKLLPLQTFNGQMYLNVGTELSEWELYLKNQLEINIPGVGKQPLQQAIIHINNEHILLSGKTTLPWGIGAVELTGELQRNGEFLLRGLAKAGVDFGKGVKMASALDIEISNEGLFINGFLTLPGGVGDFAVAGELSSERILLKGSQKTFIRFSDSEALEVDLSLEANSDKGVFLHGFMKTPLQVAKVEVDGEISSRGLALRGLIEGRLDFGVTKLSSDLSLNATTWGGAALSGAIDVPLIIIGGNVAVTGYIYGPTSFGLNGKTGAFIDLKVASANASVELGFSQSSVTIGAEAEFCVADDSLVETCAKVGLSFKPNWATGNLNICADLPIAGETCI